MNVHFSIWEKEMERDLSQIYLSFAFRTFNLRTIITMKPERTRTNNTIVWMMSSIYKLKFILFYNEACIFLSSFPVFSISASSAYFQSISLFRADAATIHSLTLEKPMQVSFH